MIHKTTQNIEWCDLNQQKQCSLLRLGSFPLENASPDPDLLPASLEGLSAHSDNKCFTILWLHIAERHLPWASLAKLYSRAFVVIPDYGVWKQNSAKNQQETQLGLASAGSWGLLHLLTEGRRASQLQEKDGLRGKLYLFSSSGEANLPPSTACCGFFAELCLAPHLRGAVIYISAHSWRHWRYPPK